MKRFIPFLISLVTLASCTGMLDDMQSQIDDLDSRVTALEKDSKLISENLSTVKKDLEAGLEAISILQKSTAEIADTLAARKARLQNDMDVSMKLIQTALYNIDRLDRNSSEFAQSVVDAYAAINVVQKLSNQNSSLLNVFNLRLATFETSLKDICNNSTYSRKCSFKNDCYLLHEEFNKYGYLLLAREENLNDSSIMSEYVYVPGTYDYEYCSKVNSDYYGVYYSYGFVSNSVERYSSYYIIDGIKYTKGSSTRFYGCQANYSDKMYWSPYLSDPRTLYEDPNGIQFSDRHSSLIWIYPCRNNIRETDFTPTIEIGEYPNRVKIALTKPQYYAIHNMAMSQFDTMYNSDSYSWKQVTDWWNSLVDSVDFLDNSFKL